MEDMRRLDHCLKIRPGSETIVCSADCVYATHPDGYSNDGVALGFEGTQEIPNSFFIFASGKQTTIAKSSCHGEHTSANVGADYIVWARQLMDRFGVIDKKSRLDRRGSKTNKIEENSNKPSILRQDNQSTIHLNALGR